DGQLRDELHQVLLREDGDSVGIPRAREGGRILAGLDAGDLGGGEGDDLNRWVVAENDVEVVEVSSGGSHDEDAAQHRHGRGSLRSSKAFLGLFTAKAISTLNKVNSPRPRRKPAHGLLPKAGAPPEIPRPASFPCAGRSVRSVGSGGRMQS